MLNQLVGIFYDRYISVQLQPFDLCHKQCIIKVISEAAQDCLCDQEAVGVLLPF